MRLKRAMLGLTVATGLTLSAPNPAPAQTKEPQKLCFSTIVTKAPREACTTKKNGNNVEEMSCFLKLPKGKYVKVSFTAPFLESIADKELGAIVAANMVLAAEGKLEREGCTKDPLPPSVPEKSEAPKKPGASDTSEEGEIILKPKPGVKPPAKPPAKPPEAKPAPSGPERPKPTVPKAELPKADVKPPEIGELPDKPSKADLVRKLQEIREFLKNNDTIVVNDAILLGAALMGADMHLKAGNPSENDLANARGYIMRAYEALKDLRVDPQKAREAQARERAKIAEAEASRDKAPKLFGRDEKSSMEVLKSALAALKARYKQAKAKFSLLENKLYFVLEVDAKGAVTGLSVSPKLLFPSEQRDLVAMFLDAFRNVRFEPSDNPTKVTLPVFVHNQN